MVKSALMSWKELKEVEFWNERAVHFCVSFQNYILFLFFIDSVWVGILE